MESPEKTGYIQIGVLVIGSNGGDLRSGVRCAKRVPGIVWGLGLGIDFKQKRIHRGALDDRMCLHVSGRLKRTGCACGDVRRAAE